MHHKIGYFVPEFPGQTHAFFWRELRALKTLGVEPVLISTRLPPTHIMSHEWSEDARSSTKYLSPLSSKDCWAILLELLRCGPVSWLRIVQSALAQCPRRRVPHALALIPFAALLSSYLRSRGVTHAHVHSCADAAFLAMLASRLSGISYGITLHGPLSDYGPQQIQKWRYAEYAVVITQRLAKEIQSTLGSYVPKALTIAPMGVDISKFHRSIPYVPWDGRTKLKIFSCGRLNPCKGYNVLIEAVYALRNWGFKVRLEIAGADDSATSNYRTLLEDLIERLDLQGFVTLLGAISEDTVRECLENAHIFALASLHEPLGVVIMEAMSMGVPVIATAAGGVPELITDGVDGLLARPNDPITLAQMISKLAEDQDLALLFSANGRKKIETRFHPGISAAAIHDSLTCFECARPISKARP